MSNLPPTFAGWYPNQATGGANYWDGSQWTGDSRPPRREFAAEAHDSDNAVVIGILGAMFGGGMALMGWGAMRTASLPLAS